MNDQAQLLRQMVNRFSEEPQTKPYLTERPMHIITVASGKGGVGKSNFSVNLAIALKKLGRHPLILDADFGLANVEIILGESPRYHLAHLMRHQCQIEQLITQSKYGVPFISGGSGVQEMNFLTKDQIDKISHELSRLSQFADILIIDTGAGINDIVVKFSTLADMVYIVVTPEPTAITDGYALTKTLISHFSLKTKLKFVVNKADSQSEAHQVFNKLAYASQQFLKYPVDYAGFIPYDEQLFKAVKHQVPLLEYAPQAKASSAYFNMAKMYLAAVGLEGDKVQLKENWISRFKRIFG